MTSQPLMIGRARDFQPPYLSVRGDDADEPVLVLTVDAEALTVCDRCPHLHIRVLDGAATPEDIRHFADILRAWADQLEEA